MTAQPTGRRLSRDTDGRPKAPVRIVHLGLGNFFRAHQCYYTEHAPDASSWGIAAFVGRGAGPAQEMAEQDDLYTLVVNHADGPVAETISSIVAVHAAEDLPAWYRYFVDPQLAVVTMTVTEAGYRRNEHGGLDLADPGVAADLEALRADPAAQVESAPVKLVAGLLARRDAGAGPLTICPCDNVPDNGEMAHRVVLDGARQIDPSLAAWIQENVGFVTTMVDRITPRATEQDRLQLLQDTGIDDPALVMTEPYLEWVLAGNFVAGRPAWDAVGANFVEDTAPFEERKLWLLNGSHSLMAYGASIRGHETVAEAIADPVVRDWVNAWWDDASPHLSVHADEVTAYREALLERYANPNIRHLLAQIAADGTQKVPIRIVPALRAERAAGRLPMGAMRAVAAWLCHLRGAGAPVTDAHADEVLPLVAGPLPEAAERLLGWLGVDDAEVTGGIVALARELVPQG